MTRLRTSRRPRVTAPGAVTPPEDGVAGAPQSIETTSGDDAVRMTGAVIPPVFPGELRKTVDAPQPIEPSSPHAMPGSPAMTPTEARPDGDDRVKPAPSLTDPPKPTTTRTRAADQPAKYRGQVAVFVSRKEKRIFVRQGFIPIFDLPVAIENPDQPLGTHVFTAMGFTDQGAGMRWNLITMAPGSPRAVEHEDSRSRRGDSRRKPKPAPQAVAETKPPSSAAEALNRIQMPQEAIERISEVLIPGSSLVVSDEGLGRETGRYTEFIVLTR